MNGEKGILFTQGNEACVGPSMRGCVFSRGIRSPRPQRWRNCCPRSCRMWAAGLFRWRTRFPHCAPCARRRWLGTRP